MLAVNKIVCVFLLSCFDNELIDYEKCPQNCKCYSAPKDGYNWNEKSKSLICDNIKDLTDIKLKTLQPINTLAVGVEQKSRTDPMNGLSQNNFHINNLYLFGIQTETTPMSVNSISPLIGLNVNALQVLTLVDLNLNTFNWMSLLEFKELKAIHIENCDLTKIDVNSFGLLKASKIVSLSIIGSQLETIDEKTFDGWNHLKMLYIVGNPLKEMHWLNVRLPRLWYLNLEDNFIWRIPELFHEWLPRLKVLKLDKNNLKVLYWTQIQPLLPRLQEFPIEENTLCINEDVEELYKSVEKYSTTNSMPAFFSRSMKSMHCKHVSENLKGTPTFLCVNYLDSYEKDEQAYIHCVNWKGNKT